MNPNARDKRPERLLRIQQVEELVGLRKTTIYSAMKKGEFPSHVRTGARAVAWRESEIADWVAQRKSALTPSATGAA